MSEAVVFCGHCLATRLTLVEVPSPTSSSPTAVSLQCRCGGYTVHYTSLLEALRAWERSGAPAAVERGIDEDDAC